MKRKDRIFICTILTAIVLGILPFIILGFYYRPHSDDFLFANLSNQFGWLGLQKWLYMNWGGRFSSTAIIGLINPLNFKNYSLFSLHASLGILLFCFLLYSLNGDFFKKTLNKPDVIILTGYTVVFFFYIMPGISDGLYWFIGFILYFLAIILFLIWLKNLAKLIEQRNSALRTILTSVLGMVLVGFNEVILTTTLTTLILLISFQVFFQKKIRRDIILVTFFITLSALAEVLAPGNFRRVATVKDVFPGNNGLDLFYSTFALGTGMILNLIIKTPFIPFCILVVAVLSKATFKSGDNYYLQKVSPLYSIISCGLIYFSSVFPGVYAGLGNYGRTLNVSFFVFIVGVLFWLYHLLIYYSSYFETIISFVKKNNITIQVLSIAISIPFFIKNNNFSVAYNDLFSGKAKQSLALMNERIDKLERSRGLDSITLIYINPSKLAETIYSPTLVDEKNEYNKPKLEEYYNIKNIKFIGK